MTIRWLPEAESQRDSIKLLLQGKALLKFERDLKNALEQLEMFPESARMLAIAGGRSDLRELVFGGGYSVDLWGVFPRGNLDHKPASPQLGSGSRLRLYRNAKNSVYYPVGELEDSA